MTPAKEMPNSIVDVTIYCGVRPGPRPRRKNSSATHATWHSGGHEPVPMVGFHADAATHKRSFANVVADIAFHLVPSETPRLEDPLQHCSVNPRSGFRATSRADHLCRFSYLLPFNRFTLAARIECLESGSGPNPAPSKRDRYWFSTF